MGSEERVHEESRKAPVEVQGYNGQAVVDERFQVIVHGEAFGEGQDHYHVGPMVKGAK